MSAIDEAFDFLDIDSGIRSVFKYTFDCMQIAEDVIGKYKGLYPDQRDRTHDSFKYLGPSAILCDLKNFEMYRHHCCEILLRVIDGLDVNLGTVAEMCIVCNQMSLKAPLNNDYSFVYVKMFKKIFPDFEFSKDVINAPIYESWEGAGDIIISKLQRKLTTDRGCHE